MKNETHIISFDEIIKSKAYMEFKLKELSQPLEVTRIANVHFFEFPFGYKTEDDNHPFSELLFVNKGSLGVKSEEYTGNLQKSQLIIHGTNKIHSLFCPKNGETTVIIIGFECNSDKLKYFSKAPITLDDSEIRSLAEIVKEGRNVFSPPYDVPVYDMKKKKKQVFGSEQLLKILLEKFLIELTRKFEFSVSAESEKSNFEISEIIKYVDVNFKEKISLDELAFLFKTNRSTLCKQFKIATGKTIINFINDKKISEIKKRLDNGKTVSEIADELNFESVPYFCSFFKRYTGKTPLEYKNKKEEYI